MTKPELSGFSLKIHFNDDKKKTDLRIPSVCVFPQLLLSAACGHSEKDYLLRETDCNSFWALHEWKLCLHCAEAAGLCEN